MAGVSMSGAIDRFKRLITREPGFRWVRILSSMAGTNFAWQAGEFHKMPTAEAERGAEMGTVEILTDEIEIANAQRMHDEQVERERLEREYAEAHPIPPAEPYRGPKGRIVGEVDDSDIACIGDVRKLERVLLERIEKLEAALAAGVEC